MEKRVEHQNIQQHKMLTFKPRFIESDLLVCLLLVRLVVACVMEKLLQAAGLFVVYVVKLLPQHNSKVAHRTFFSSSVLRLRSTSVPP